jgi:hypothetical protein
MRIFISIVALHIALAFPSICAGDWSTPVNLGPVVNSDSSDARPEISRDESSLFFQSNREGGHGGSDMGKGISGFPKGVAESGEFLSILGQG